MRMFVLIGGAVLYGAAVMATGLQPAPSARAKAPAGSARQGKTTYVADGCYECHNYAANGGAAGARLAPSPIPLEQFIAYVRKPTGEMPPYTRKVISDADLRDIYAYLETIPPAPAAGSIAILRK